MNCPTLALNGHFRKPEAIAIVIRGNPNVVMIGEQEWRSGESARLPPMWPGFYSRTRRHMWVEFVVGSLPCSERFFSGFSGFPLSSKTNISKFKFDLDYCRALYHEPLARVIAQALPVFGIKFTFTLICLRTDTARRDFWLCVISCFFRMPDKQVSFPLLKKLSLELNLKWVCRLVPDFLYLLWVNS